MCASEDERNFKVVFFPLFIFLTYGRNWRILFYFMRLSMERALS